MQISYLFKQCTSVEKERARTYCEQKLSHIEKMLQSVDPKAVKLDIHIERLPKKHAYTVTFILHLPYGKFYAFEDDHTIAEAIDLAKDKLIMQLERQHERFETRKRSQKAHEDPEVVFEDTRRSFEKKKPPTKKEFFRRILPLLGDIRRHLDREIGYAYMEGELDIEKTTIDGVLHEALLAVYKRLSSDQEDTPLDVLVYQEAFRIFRRERAEEARERYEQLSLERDRKKMPEDKRFATLIEEKIDPWQPDDDLKFETMAREEEWFDPGDERSREELKIELMDAMRDLPPLWRQTLFLSVIDGLSLKEIAQFQHRAAKEVEEDLTFAKEYMKERLV